MTLGLVWGELLLMGEAKLELGNGAKGASGAALGEEAPGPVQRGQECGSQAETPGKGR